MKKMGIGYYELAEETIVINQGKESVAIEVTNSGDRTIQVGSHFHFFEVNKDLVFIRNKAYGLHLDIPSGTSIRWSPGSTKTIRLTEYSGEKRLYGFSGLVNGEIQDKFIREAAILKAMEKYGPGDSRDE